MLILLLVAAASAPVAALPSVGCLVSGDAEKVVDRHEPVAAAGQRGDHDADCGNGVRAVTAPGVEAVVEDQDGARTCLGQRSPGDPGWRRLENLEGVAELARDRGQAATAQHGRQCGCTDQPRRPVQRRCPADDPGESVLRHLASPARKRLYTSVNTGLPVLRSMCVAQLTLTYGLAAIGLQLVRSST